MTHTPGPWELDKSCDGFRTVSNGSLTICTVGEADLFPQVENDAHLIAAAPELLRAVKRLHAHAIATEAMHARTIGNYQEFSKQELINAERRLIESETGTSALEFAMQAIAKAEGKG